MYCSAFQAIGHSGTTTIRKISVNAESASVSAISFGLRWRMAPSTSAIIRSRNDSPAPLVIRTTIRSESDDRAAGHAGTIAARFANDGRRFAGNGRLVDRRDALDDFAVAGNDLSRFDNDTIAGYQLGRGNLFNSVSLEQAIGDRIAASATQRLGLCLATRLGERRREIGEQHGQKQPHVQRDEIRERNLAGRVAQGRLNDEQQGQERAHFHHEHHRVFPLDVRPQHDERLLQRRPGGLGVSSGLLRSRRCDWGGS